MELMEKVSYLKGLMDGLELDTTTKEGKILAAMADVLQEMSDTIYDISDEVSETVDIVDTIDSDLGDLEEFVYECDCCDEDDCDCCCDEDDDDFDEDDEEMYECTCPTCGDTIMLCESLVEDGSVECPNCHEMLEFGLEDEDITDED